MRFPSPWLPIAVGLVSQAVSAQETALLSSFKGAFKRPSTPRSLDEKRAALDALSGLDSAAVAKALIAAFGFLEQEAEPLCAARRTQLFRDGGSASLWPLRLRLQPVRDLQEEVLACLRHLRSQEAAQAMLETLLGGKSHPFALRRVLSEQAVNLSANDLQQVRRTVDASARNTPSEGEVILLLKLVESLGRRAQRSAPWATSNLRHESEAVRLHAAKALATLSWPGSIEPLIDRIDKERGATREQILDTLVVLTAQGPGNTATAWRAWLAASGGPYVRGEIRLGDGNAGFRKRNGDSDDRLATTKGTYFGIPQEGSHILYVFDASMSMRQPAGARSRWDRCRQELHSALDKLPPRKTFNLLAFADKLQVFSRRMLQATPKNIARAHAWIDRARLEFQTNIHDALELSFYIAGRGAKDRYYPVVVDTIFLLSDGAPTKPSSDDGRVGQPGEGPRIQRDDIGQILAAVRRWNPLGRIVIHTIGLGLDEGEGRMTRRGMMGGRQGARDFLRRLAQQNDGRFVEPK